MRFLRWSAIVVSLLLIAAAATVYFSLRAGLPRLEGEIAATDIVAPAVIERDASGVPTITAASRRDLAYATGFVHAQDRFFQMDMQRRAAAGELAELFGAVLLPRDRGLRIHGFRRVAQQVIAEASAADRGLLEAYAAGVNHALDSARSRPWEYLVLRATPRRWLPEDSVLMGFSMYLSLNDSTSEHELARSELYEALPPQLFAFLHPVGTEWDAPLVGGPWQAPAIPGPEIFDLRQSAGVAASLQQLSSSELEEPNVAGSNSWAVAASRSANGAALLANDMHLPLSLPHIWYRARLIVAGGPEACDLIGVTLPGLPMLMVGSNRKVAWGYTDTHGDWSDLVIVNTDPEHPDRYLTSEGSEAFVIREETIQVRKGSPQRHDVKVTRWGPIVASDDSGRPLALAWTAHDARATDLGMLNFENAGSVEELLDAANRAGGPVQNVVAADVAGHIGWSLMGRMPVRAAYDSTLPTAWDLPDSGWIGWHSPEEYPRIVDPAADRIWTANTRTTDAATWSKFLGDDDYDLGARAAQIRDSLFALPNASAMDMVRIQMDDRALFLARWRDLLLDLLDRDGIANHASRLQARDLVENWSGHAAADDVGYRIVRAFRLRVRQNVFDALTASVRAQYPGTRFAPSPQFEGPLWQLVTQRPPHLLDPRYERWEDALLASLDMAISSLVALCGDLPSCTWGRHNTLQMQHPLSAALPVASRWLDMPAEQLSGDSQMPRVQASQFGASERMVVSPGREEEGYFQMPGGPVDNPLSPFYGAGHAEWARGEPLPLLPGEAQYTLRLVPQR